MTSMSCRRPLRSHGDRFCFPPPFPTTPLPPAPLAAPPLMTDLPDVLEEIVVFLAVTVPLAVALDLVVTVVLLAAEVVALLVGLLAAMAVDLPFGLVVAADTPLVAVVLFLTTLVVPLLAVIFALLLLVVVVIVSEEFEVSILARFTTGPFCGNVIISRRFYQRTNSLKV